MKLLEPHEHLNSRHGLGRPQKLTWFNAAPIVAVAVGMGVLVVIVTMAAGTPVAFEAETGTLAGGASTTTVSGASGGSAVKFAAAGTPTPTPVGAITHGEQLTTSMVGYTALGVTQAQLQTVNPGSTRISTYPGNAFPSWIPTTPYVYNNNASNHGGIVPAGGMTIDGFFVPAGTWVSQFQDYTAGLTIEGSCGGAGSNWPGIVFRGIRFRQNSTAPGFFAENHSCSNTGGKLWMLYSDMGGKGPADNQYNEIPLTISMTPAVVYRNYISYTSTGIQINTNDCLVAENYVEKLTLYYGETGPPAESGPKHLNGFTTNGGMANIRIERNKILLQSPDEAGHSIGQTDALSFFQDFGSFPGTGTNDNGTVGYQVLDNYLGGGGYTIYAGLNAGKPTTSVKNMVMTGNKVTTQWWPNGGAVGPLAAAPPWGTNGNVWANNTWADGPKAGQTF